MKSVTALIALLSVLYACTYAFVMPTFKFPAPRSQLGYSNGDGGGGDMQSEQTKFPRRNDICRVILSGVIGETPVQKFLKSGLNLATFPLAVTGHFDPISEFEANTRLADTMWIKAEAWNDEAKEAAQIPKGTKIQVVGKLILNKWIDKGTGEERKYNVFRITKFLDEQQIDAIEKTLADLHPPGMNIPTSSHSNNQNQGRNNNYPDSRGGGGGQYNRQQPQMNNNQMNNQMNSQSEYEFSDEIPF